MKKKNFIFATAILIMTIVFLAACNSSEGSTSGDSSSDSSSNFPNKPITVIVPWSAGGGTDTGTRVLQPYLEEELGVTVNVVNKTGGGGWVGWNELANAKPDGYTIGVANSPHIITGYLNPSLNRDKDLDNFIGLGMHVIDPDTIAIRPDDDRFSTLEELIDYAKENEVTVSATGEGKDEHLVMLNFNKKYGTNFKPVHFEGASESKSNVLGGHVDVLVANLGEVLSLHDNKEVKVLGVAAQERSDFMPNVPTLEEEGFEVYQESSRGFIAPADTNEEAVKVLKEALDKTINNEDHIKEMNELGFGVNHESGEDYMNILKKDEQAILELTDLLGWE
ncbi:hypothetical protein GCM10007063_27040 [Lentibacillus kapialis]|uniref:Tripartite tricarboxylate transporter substrate binding protein n=1 Tax=Lentibacillus kapialis TaxID=340214 RepID=A0A917Q0D0_9BACI|nr:tripartite tricarboxylate transporter substrate binding protein [Lentibacillus kapialis]GGK03443.1 hypothetical protein GCM10007063_27040 [Lentibacillus kapialis]